MIVQEVNTHMSSNTDAFFIPFYLASEGTDDAWHARFRLGLENDIHEAIRRGIVREQISTSAMKRTTVCSTRKRWIFME
jgi:hypothetical protein